MVAATLYGLLDETDWSLVTGKMTRRGDQSAGTVPPLMAYPIPVMETKRGEALA
jgi:hypothetical protein